MWAERRGASVEHTARIGIDLGGTKIEGIVLSTGGTIVARERVQTPKAYEETVDAIALLVSNLERSLGGDLRVGVGIPGAIDLRSGFVKNANSIWLNGRPLKSDLEAKLGRPIRVMNDANCFAISEASDGAGVDADVVFGVILGTGVGGGIVVRKRLINGPNLIAGEWGHNPLPWMSEAEYPGPVCYCGRRGCIETFLSGPRFEAEYSSCNKGQLAAREIVMAAQVGNPEATALLSKYNDRLARALASVINVLDPDVVVLGGGMSNLPHLAASVEARLPRYVFSNSVSTRVVQNHHGDSSGVRGAAWLWPNQ